MLPPLHLSFQVSLSTSPNLPLLFFQPCLCLCVLLAVFSTSSTSRGWKTPPDLLTPTIRSLIGWQVNTFLYRIWLCSVLLTLSMKRLNGLFDFSLCNEKTKIINRSVLNKFWVTTRSKISPAGVYSMLPLKDFDAYSHTVRIWRPEVEL